MAETDRLEYRIEIWDAADSRVVELIALCANSLIAKAGYHEALKLRPGASLILRHRAQIIARA
jgi:hypothetical protein